jgi:glycosyltransferase involved in cell wall biosynthesis
MRYGPSWIPGLEEKAMRYMIWYYNTCAFVSTPSEFLLHEMKDNGLCVPSEAIHNPARLLTHQDPRVQKPALKKEFGVSDKTVIYAGRLAPEKNIDVLICAIARAQKDVPNINLLIAGDGSQKKELADLAEKIGIKQAVVFAGMLGKPALARAYGASDVFATASTSENQPITLMEAMSCGLPVVGARSRGLPEYIKPETGFLFAPGNEEGLARRLAELLNNPELARTMGRAGSDVVKRFSLDEIMTAWEAIYERIIVEHRN